MEGHNVREPLPVLTAYAATQDTTIKKFLTLHSGLFRLETLENIRMGWGWQEEGRADAIRKGQHALEG